MPTPIKSFSAEQLTNMMTSAGLSTFRAEQMLTWIYAKNAHTYDQMSNIPKVIREQFDLAFPLYIPEILEKRSSVDSSRKYLLRFHDGAVVETVGLPSRDGRLTVCCSSQSGCAMSCAFCATGKAGFHRNLDPGEIVDQVLAVQEDFEQRVTNVVVMGQGEPFMNYDAVMGALRIINHPKLLNVGARHITVSTCGLIDGIERFSEEPEQFTLAVSLHAARQEVRDKLMPALSKQRLGALRKSLVRYAEITGRRFSFEYALMANVNDGAEDLKALIEYCQRLLCHVNLIPLNEVEGSSFKPVGRAVMQEWQEALENAGIVASVRRSRGSDIAGACGQLASLSESAQTD